jgi:hypothetical protein
MLSTDRMTSTMRSESFYDFSQFQGFFERQSFSDAKEAQLELEQICASVDRILYSEDKRLYFLEVCFFLNFDIQSVPSRLWRFSYLGPRIVRRDQPLVSHLHEVYYISKFYTMDISKQNSLSDNLYNSNLDAKRLFELLNSSIVQDFFDSAQSVDYSSALKFLCQSEESLGLLVSKVRRIIENFFGMRLLTKLVYYLSRNMYTSCSNFLQDFRHRFEFAKYISKNHLGFDIFDLNHPIVYNYDCFVQISDMVFVSDKENGVQWAAEYIDFVSKETTDYIHFKHQEQQLNDNQSLNVIQQPREYNFHAVANTHVYNQSVVQEIEKCKTFLRFKEYVTQTQFYLLDPSESYKHFTLCLKEVDKDIPYNYKFLSTMRDFVYKTKMVAPQ